jgi:RNA polymerase sigma factor (TIGR02999 family)
VDNQEAGDITKLLIRWNEGDREAYDRLMPMVYDELKRIARRVEAQHGDAMMQPTAVVHELYLKLVESASRNYESRLHFFSLAARAMRQILIDRGRMRGAAKRGGAVALTSLEEHHLGGPAQNDNVIDLHLALQELERFDLRKARMVELRYFGGLKMEEIGDLEKTSCETVRKELRLAEAWLMSYLRRDESSAQ